ncbi:MAG: HlyD family efflux transporter periplasmic adaptor subunit [Armatimonadetes bacterium]|nr:HlyD family efflux transporter periplasmic adaptor subunit [Armatimonadota bacterium]
MKQAEAAYRAAKAKLEMALNGARPQEVAQAKAAVDQANAAYKTAKDSYDRFHGLYEAGVIPKQQEEEVELKYLSAKAAKEAAEAKLSLVKEGARREEIEQAREGVRAAEAQLRMAKDAAMQIALRRKEAIAAGYKADAAKGQLDEALAFKSETEIIAPISGYISERISEPGEMVSAGFPILSIVKNKNFKVKVYADESKFGSLDLNSQVKVIIPALNNRELDARVIRISPSADFATKKATNEQGSFDVRSLEVVVVIQGDHSDLRNGMTARVKLPYSRRK